jgi:hypothetical protein
VQLVIEVLALVSLYALGVFWAFKSRRALQVDEKALPPKVIVPAEPAVPVVSVEYQEEA